VAAPAGLWAGARRTGEDASGRAGDPPPRPWVKGHPPLVGGSLARRLLRGSAPARAAAATRSAPHPPAGGHRRHAPPV